MCGCCVSWFLRVGWRNFQDEGTLADDSHLINYGRAACRRPDAVARDEAHRGGKAGEALQAADSRAAPEVKRSQRFKQTAEKERRAAASSRNVKIGETGQEKVASSRVNKNARGRTR